MTKPDKHQRSVLPIPDVRKPGLTTFDAKDPDSRFPPIETVVPPAGAPNVLVILLDDVGFGSSSAFGGPCETPVAEKLAAKLSVDTEQLPQPYTLNDVVCWFLASRGRREEAYTRVRSILRDAGFQPPKALRQLAQIAEIEPACRQGGPRGA